MNSLEFKCAVHTTYQKSSYYKCALPNNLIFYVLLDLRKPSFHTPAHPLHIPVYCCPFPKQQLQCSTSLSVQARQKTEYHKRDFLTRPFSYLLQASKVLHGASYASRAQSCKRLEIELRKHANNCPAKPWRQTAKEGRERDGGKGLGLESGLTGALRQSLNKAGEKQRNRESKRAAGPGLPRIASFFLIACWRAI